MSDLVRFRRFKDSDGFATGAMVLHEDGGWVRYQDAAKRIRELEAEVARLKAQSRALTTVLEGEREKLRAVGDRIKGKNIFEMRSTPLGSVHDAIGGELEALLK